MFIIIIMFLWHEDIFLSVHFMFIVAVHFRYRYRFLTCWRCRLTDWNTFINSDVWTDGTGYTGGMTFGVILLTYSIINRRHFLLALGISNGGEQKSKVCCLFDFLVWVACQVAWLVVPDRKPHHGDSFGGCFPSVTFPLCNFWNISKRVDWGKS